MEKKVKRKVSIVVAIILVLGLIPIQTGKIDAQAASKGYSITKDSGTYMTSVDTTVTVKKGYKVYYTTNGTFSTTRVIRSGKTKTFSIRKNTTIRLITVKNKTKVSRRKLNGSLRSKAKSYRYVIQTTTQSDTPSSDSSILMQTASAYTTAKEGNGYKLEADGENTVLTISKSGTYTVSTDGAIKGRIINKATDGEVTLILNGVNLTSANKGDDGVILGKKSSSPLTVTVAAGSVNTLTATGEGETETKSDGTTDTDYPAGILVKKGSALTINGTGTLSITSKHGSGIKVKYNDTEGEISTASVNNTAFWATTLTIRDNPTINITCNEDDEAAYKSDNYNTDSYDAHQDAISSKNSLAIYGGTLNLAAGDDGIHAEATAHIYNGTIKVTSSTEALEGAKVVIDNGTLDLKAYDDGINAANGDLTSNASGEDTNIYCITINGGTVTVNAEGDGIDSNGNTYITGGDVKVYGPSKGGNGALDVADMGAGGVLKVTGGTLYATAAGSDMAVAPSGGGYASVVFTTATGGMGGPGEAASSGGTTFAVGTTLTIRDSAGNTVGSLVAQKTTGWLLYCGSNIVDGQTYTLYNGDTKVATATAGTSNSSGGMMPPGGGTPPSDGMIPPTDGMTPPSDDRTPPGGGMTPPGNGPTPPNTTEG